MGADEPIRTAERGSCEPTISDFLVEPTRRLDDWRWLWAGDHTFPIRSHRGFLGRLLVVFKRLFRPLVQVPQNDLWERQRIFNLVLLEHLQRGEDLRAQVEGHEARLAHLEAFMREGLYEVMRHNDALFARVDQKMDRARRETRDLWARLGGALAQVESAPQPALERTVEDHGYLELERRWRGTLEEVTQRLRVYLPHLRERGVVLDLGCGRGEALALLEQEGIPARGIDSSTEMVRQCHERGLEAEQADLFAALAAVPADSLGAVVSFHVIEHLPAATIERLVRLAWRALRPGGMLILETPNPLSLVVAARNFWPDPTHRRPVHPESLRLAYELAGFDPVERLDLRPFPETERLPEIDLSPLAPEQRLLGDEVNRLRDRLDALLFGYQDYALLGTKPG